MVEATKRPPSGGFAQALGEQFSIQASIGGVRGLLESVLPLTVFSVVYGLDRDLRLSTICALVPSVILVVWRLVAREPLTQAVSGIVGIGIGAFLAIRTGRAENIFLPSIIKNAAYATVYTLSIIVRWPIIGVLLGFLVGEQFHWRRVPARARAYALATWVWVAVFVVRLAIQVPLWLAHRVAALALINVALGLPLFGAALWLTWVILRRVPVAHPPVPADGGAAGDGRGDGAGGAQDGAGGAQDGAGGAQDGAVSRGAPG